MFFVKVVQLRHKKSGTFLTVAPKAVAKVEKDTLRCYLPGTTSASAQPPGSAYSWFTVLPRYKMRQRGDLVEVNEAFAAVTLTYLQEFDLSDDRVNVNGGSIALGHPLGATGAVLLNTLLDVLEEQDKSVGLVTLCIGGGMGTATIIERV